MSFINEEIHVEDHGEMTITRWALQFLQGKGYRVHHRKKCVTHVVDSLFFAHPDSLHLLKLFPYVVVIDNRYKTNRYNMPLVEMIGLTSTGNTFNIAHAIMGEEDISHYNWMLTCLRSLYEDLKAMPTAIVTDSDLRLVKSIDEVFGVEVKHLLCWVHIKENIIEYATRMLKDEKKSEDFASQCWELWLSCTEASYEEKLQKLRESWSKESWLKELVTYTERTWLDRYKKNIVKAWTDTHLHFYMRTTDRTEGMHHILKNIVDSSRGFNTMTLKIHHAVESQISMVKTSMDKSCTQYPIEVEDLPPEMKKLFSQLFYRVTKKCLKILVDFYYDLEGGLYEDDCVDHWMRNCFGLPCIHEVANCIVKRTPIMPSEVHPFWKQLVWEGITDDTVLNAEKIPMCIVHVRWRVMSEKFERGELSAYQVNRIVNKYLELKEKDTLLKEPQEIISKEKEATTKHPTKKDGILAENELPEVVEISKKRKEREVSEQTSLQPLPLPCRSQEHLPNNKAKTVVSSGSVTQLRNTEPLPQAPRQPIFHAGMNFGVDNVDYFMLAFIQRAKDVEADGHCGYRSLAELMGWGETEYYKVRIQLTGELTRNKCIYEAISPVLAPIDDLIRNVNYILSPCDQKYCLDMPIVGLAFATLFQVALVLLSWDDPHMCLPMTACAESPRPPTQILAMALVGNKDHFIPVWLSDHAPLPPIPAAWHNFHDPHMCLPMTACAESPRPPTQILAMALVGNKDHFIPVWLSDHAPLPPIPAAWHNFHDTSVDGWDSSFGNRIEEFSKYRIMYGRNPQVN